MMGQTQAGVTTGSPLRGLALAIMLTLFCSGCAKGVLGSDASDMPGSTVQTARCTTIDIQWPLPGSVVRSQRVNVRGTVEASGTQGTGFISIDEQQIQVRNNQFEVELTREVGAHTLEARCEGASQTVEYEVGFGKPELEILQPMSGTMIPMAQERIQVTGRAQDSEGCDGVRMNGELLELANDGTFSAEYRAAIGMNHLDFELECPGGEKTDIRRSFLYGHLSDFDTPGGSLAAVQISGSALDVLTEGIERHFTPAELERMLDQYMGRNGDIEIHEFRYSRLETTFTPEQGHLRVRLRLHDFGVKVTYHYFAGRIRGWAEANPAEIEASVALRMTNDGRYDLTIENPRVELADFELDLSDIYSVVEDFVEPYVRDMGRDALLDVLRGLVVENLIDADLMNQTFEFIGHQGDVRLPQSLMVAPNGISAIARTELTPMPAVKQLAGVWSAGHGDAPRPLQTHVSASLGVDMSIECWLRPPVVVCLMSI